MKNIRKINFASMIPVLAFLSYEVLAIIAFTLTNSYIFFAILGIVLAILLTIASAKEMKKNGYSSLLYFLYPLIIYGFLSCASNYNYVEGSIITNLFTKILVPLALVAYATIGYFLSMSKEFNLRIALTTIYGAIALLTLINLVITMVQYVPFYTLLYKDKYVYYAGSISDTPIGETAYALMGFEVSEVSIQYFSLFPAMLLSSVGMLFFISFKEDKRMFILYSIFALLAIISLAFTISVETIIPVFFIVVISFIFILFGKKKWKIGKLKCVIYVFVILAILTFVVFFLNAQENWGFVSWLRNIISGNSLLNRLFNSNRYSAKYKAIIADFFKNYIYNDGAESYSLKKIFGFQPYKNPFGVEEGSNSWFFDNFMTSGIFGAAIFIVMLVIGFKNVYKYYINSDDAQPVKMSAVLFIVCTLVFMAFSYDITPYIYFNTNLPLYVSPALFIVLVLFGYCTYKGNIKKVDIVEEKEEIKENEEIVL